MALVVCGLFLAACGGATGAGNGNDVATAAARVKAGVESQAPGVSLTVQAAATTVAPQLAGAATTAQAVATGAVAPNGGVPVPSQLLDQAKAQAAQALGVPVDQLTVERVEQVQWRDSSLGCAEAGKVYSQVVTPGVRVVLSGGGKRVEVHADVAGQRVVTCQNPTP